MATEYGSGRDSLVAAAIRVVAATGLRGLTYRAVAAEAGASHGLVAHHFGTLHALLTEALRSSVTQSLAATSFDPPATRIADFAADLPEQSAALADLHAFQYELVLASRRDDALVAAVADYQERYRAAIHTQLVVLGIDDEGFTDLVWASLDGIVFQQVVLGNVAASAAALGALRESIRVRSLQPAIAD